MSRQELIEVAPEIRILRVVAKVRRLLAMKRKLDDCLDYASAALRVKRTVFVTRIRLDGTLADLCADNDNGEEK